MGEEIRNVWCGHTTICNLVQLAKAGVGTLEFQWLPVRFFQHS